MTTFKKPIFSNVISLKELMFTCVCNKVKTTYLYLSALWNDYIISSYGQASPALIYRYQVMT